MDNHEHWSVPEKKVSSAQKKTSVLGFFRSHALCFILTHKNPPDPLSDNSASSPDLFPNTLHNIVMMRNVQCRVYVGPCLPVKLGVSTF